MRMQLTHFIGAVASLAAGLVVLAIAAAGCTSNQSAQNAQAAATNLGIARAQFVRLNFVSKFGVL